MTSIHWQANQDCLFLLTILLFMLFKGSNSFVFLHVDIKTLFVMIEEKVTRQLAFCDIHEAMNAIIPILRQHYGH